MCGIAGYIGPKNASQVLLVALERLKYRGYDSAGLVISDGGKLHLRRAAGKLKELDALITAQPLAGHCGIAHTRWATHGPPVEPSASLQRWAHRRGPQRHHREPRHPAP